MTQRPIRSVRLEDGCPRCASLSGHTQRPFLSQKTTPESDPQLLSEGVQTDKDGKTVPRVDPFSFGINRHVWTTDDIAYKFDELLNKSARHLITDSRQPSLMKKGIQTWIPHMARSATQKASNEPWSSVDIAIWTESFDSFKTLARGRYPRSVRDPSDGEQATTMGNKSSIRWNKKAYIIDREAAYEVFWGELPAAYLGAAYAIAIGGGLIGAAIWAVFVAILLETHSDYREVCIHELGHTLGLGHSPRKSSIMYPTEHGGRWTLGEHDVRAIRSLYPERLSANEPSNPLRAQAHTTGLFTDVAGTESRVLDLLGTPRRLLAFTTLGFQDSLTNFDDDNTVAAEVYAIGGRDDIEESEVGELWHETEVEMRNQLSHEYDVLDGGERDECIGTHVRQPLRLSMRTDHINRDPCNATSLYAGYGVARGNRVQFRALSFHPGDHLVFATGIVLALPDDPLDEELDYAAPTPPPPPPPTDPDLDIMMKPDIQTPPPPPLGYGVAPPPPGPQIVGELPPPGPQIAGVVPTAPPDPGPGWAPKPASPRTEWQCCVGGRVPPNVQPPPRARPPFMFSPATNASRVALRPSEGRLRPRAVDAPVESGERGERGTNSRRSRT